MLAEFALRCLISGSIAILLYVAFGLIVTRRWNRTVSRDIWRYDFKLGIVSLVTGSPMIQGFSMLAEKWQLGFMYNDVSQYGWVWWVVSLPIYVLLWDLWFYVGHLALHWRPIYRLSHFRHHACRPPVPWSGIAIDPIETVFSGILPYVAPLFFLPFHTYTVYALNIALMGWALVVHSSMNFTGNWFFFSTKDHNLHHTFGLKNVNFAAVFAIWDRLGRTLEREKSPPWWGKPEWRLKTTAPKDGPNATDAHPIHDAA